MHSNLVTNFFSLHLSFLDFSILEHTNRWRKTTNHILLIFITIMHNNLVANFFSVHLFFLDFSIFRPHKWVAVVVGWAGCILARLGLTCLPTRAVRASSAELALWPLRRDGATLGGHHGQRPGIGHLTTYNTTDTAGHEHVAPLTMLTAF